MADGDLLTTAEHDAVLRILGAAEEGPARLARVEQIRAEDARVLRVGDPDRTWIVKRAGVPLGDDRLYAAWGFYAEWVGAATVTGVGADVSPRFLGGDAESTLLVFEDVGPNRDLSQVLRGDDRALAERSLDAMAEALGRLHAATSAPEARDRYLALWQELCGGHEPPTLRVPEGRLVAAVRSSLEAAAMGVPPPVDDDLDEVQAWATNPPTGAVLIHGDPCLDNWMLDREGRPRLIDFQGAVFAPATLDGAYARAPLPTCWCVRRIPPDAVARFEERHRAAVGPAVPGVADVDAYRAELTMALAWWFVGQVVWRLERAVTETPGERHRHLGFELLGQRQALVLRLDSFVHLSRETGRLSRLADWAATLRTAIVERWGEPHVDLFPAFGGPPA